MTRTSFFLELVALRGKNGFEPHPQNKILVHFRGSFQNLRRSPRHFYMEMAPGLKVSFQMLTYIFKYIIKCHAASELFSSNYWYWLTLRPVDETFLSFSTDELDQCWTMILYSSFQDPFGSLDLSLLKVLDMMVGELEYHTFFIDKTLYLPHLTRFIFAVFCALIPIVFMNLLVSYQSLPFDIFLISRYILPYIYFDVSFENLELQLHRSLHALHACYERSSHRHVQRAKNYSYQTTDFNP